jgi:hypothetical protein
MTKTSVRERHISVTPAIRLIAAVTTTFGTTQSVRLIMRKLSFQSIYFQDDFRVEENHILYLWREPSEGEGEDTLAIARSVAKLSRIKLA